MRILVRICASVVPLLVGCSHSAEAPVTVPFSIEVAVGNGQVGTVGQIAPIVPSIIVRDNQRNALGGATITVAVTSGGGSITGVPATTLVSGATPLGQWTLGKTPGTNVLTVASGGATTEILATGLVGAVAKLVLKSGGTGFSGTVAFPLTTNIVLQVLDQLDNPVQGVTPVITASGGGSVLLLSPISDANGTITIVRWTMGTHAGAQTLTIDAGNGAPPLVISGTAGAAAAAQLTVINALPRSAFWGAPTAPLAVLVTDPFANPVAGTTVSFSARIGGGSISGAASTVSGADGVATGGSWVLGPTFAPQIAAASVGNLSALFTGQVTSSFQVTVRYVGTVSADLQLRVQSVVDRIRGAVVGHVGDVAADNLDVSTLCGVAGVTPITETIHDLIFYVQVAPIDGPNGVLAQAGPCVERADNQLPTVSLLTIDAADAQFMTDNGIFEKTVLHEMLHGLGIGANWITTPTLMSGIGTADPRFLGAAATTAFLAAGGTASPGVPVENVGGPAIINRHWRTTVFGDELMTGSFTIGQQRPLSAITVQSLADIGYTVNVFAADNFRFPGSALLIGTPGAGRTWSFGGPAGVEQLFAPKATIDAHGRVRPLR